MPASPPPLRPPLLPVLVAVALAVVSLTHWPLWGDELWTQSLLELSFGDMLAKVGRDFHPPGYFALVWALLDPDAPDWLLRMPSAIGAVGAVALAGAAGRRWFGEAEGGIAAFALALSPFVVVYGGIARGYMFLALAAAGVLVAGLELVTGERVRAAAVGLAVAGLAAIYTHYAAAAALIGTAAGIAAGLLTRPDRGRGRWLWAAGAFVVMGLLFVPWALGPLGGQNLAGNVFSRTIRALGYLGWPVGPYQPVANWFLLPPAALGALLLLRRRTPADWMLLAWAACGLAFPLAMSDRGYMQVKFYIHAWFLPAWALLVGIGAAAVLGWGMRRLRSGDPARAVALLAGVALAAMAVGPLLVLWRLPAGPFGIRKANTAYDARIDLALFARVLPAGAPAGTMRQGGPLYVHYGADLVSSAATLGWQFESREQQAPRSIHDAFDTPPCRFTQAFLQDILVSNPQHCPALLQEVTAAAKRDGYAPYLLELAVRARVDGRFVEAESLARRAEAAATPIGWTGPSAFLAQFYAQNLGYDDALAAADRGLAIAITWQNRAAGLELYGLRGEILRLMKRDEEAAIAEACATGDGLSLPCATAEKATSRRAASPP